MNTEITSFSKYSLRKIIEKYKFLPGGSGCVARKYEILPDGYFDLAFLLSDKMCLAVLAGPYTRRTLVPVNSFELFTIRFRVGRVPDYWDIEPLDLVNTMIQLPKVFGMHSDNLCEILWAEKDFNARQKIIEGLIHKVELSFMMKNNIYCMAAELIESQGGQLKVCEVARILNVSTRTLERQFLKILGIPPKQFIRLVRFQNAVERLKEIRKVENLAGIAHDFGYFDQSHFIKDFKSLSGKSPLHINK